MARKVNVGIIGYSFMGKAHSFGYKNMPMFYDCEAIPVMKAICGRKEEGVKAAAEQYGWESYETDWQKLVAREDIDVVDVCTPGDLHVEMSIAAAGRPEDREDLHVLLAPKTKSTQSIFAS